MPEYWEDDKAARTQLQVGTPWPASGGKAFAGSPSGPKGWEMSPYVSRHWYHTAFTEREGIWTTGLNSCSALVYLFGPARGVATHGALWHVNCSVYGAEHAPAEAMKALGVSDLALKFVVIGYNQDTRGAKMSDAVKDSIRDFKAFLERYHVHADPWIYFGNDGSFGVSRDGFVGMPMRMAMDTISERRRSLSLTMEETDGGGKEATPCCSKCYITTAVCRRLELGDDCRELRILRTYRDEVLLRTAVGRAEVQQYYETAPLIVAGIEAGGDADAVMMAT
jgi:hypothetical protein